MAKILYGVAGEGFGHSSRSELIGRYLLQAGHQVLFAASGKSLAYLSTPFPSIVQPVYGLRFAYKNGSVSPIKTVWKNVVGYGQGLKTNLRLFRQVVRQFKPDLVISDFEPFSAWWAFRHRVPCLSIDHEHLLTLGEFTEPAGGWWQRLMARVVTAGYHTFANAYIVLNFFAVPLRGRGILAPPVVRQVVQQFSASVGEHITVYITDATPERRKELLDCLIACRPQPFLVYGFNEDARLDNCRLKRTSTEGFLADLASCRGVIATAGFSLISECLYFHKPMLVKPIFNQYEQMLNAHYIQKLGIGIQANHLSEQTIRAFLQLSENPIQYAEGVLLPDNQRVLEVVKQQAQKAGVPL